MFSLHNAHKSYFYQNLLIILNVIFQHCENCIHVHCVVAGSLISVANKT